MGRATESSYVFRFERSGDRASYTRQVYWDHLYAFFRQGPPVLSAARVVPANAELFALYLALKRDRTPVHRQMLPEPGRAPGVGLVHSIADIVPHEPRAVPAVIVQQTERVLQQTAELSAAFHDPQWSAALDAQRTGGSEGRGALAGGGMGFMAGLGARDAAIVGVGFEIHGIIEEHLSQEGQSRAAGVQVSSRALARRTEVREDIWRRLYSDRRYLRLIKAQIDTRGGYMSPMVRGFLRFYHRSLMERARELSELGRFDDTFVSERFCSLAGRAEADYLKTLPYYEIVMLGRVVEGQVLPNPADPERTPRSFQVDPETDLDGIVLQEVHGRLQRMRLSTIARASFRTNIKQIRYVDEIA